MYSRCCSIFSLTTVFILLIYRIKKVSPTLHSIKHQAVKDTVDLTIENGEIRHPFTYLKFDNVYEVEDEYSFFIPDVNVICNECVCVDIDKSDCTTQTDENNNQCANLVNSTMRCTIYNTFDKDLTICPNYYRMCCQVYFSKQKLSKKFIAFKLKYLESNLKLRVDSDKPYTINIQENKRNYYLLHDNIVHLHHVGHFRLLKEQWYFFEEGSAELLYSDELNTEQEIKLDKIGWFQFDEDRNELSQVSLYSLKSHLQVKPVNCQSNPPRYEWKLNANGYSSEGLLRQHSGVKLVSDTYKNSISFNKDLKMLEIHAKFLPNITAFVSVNVSLPFNFTSNILEYPNCVRKLSLIFTNGNGKFIIKILNSHWEEIYTSSSSIANSSVKHPVEVLFPLKCKNYESSWLCVYQDNHKYCQPLEIISIESITLRAADQSTITSTLLSLIVGVQVKQHLPAHQHIWITAPVCIGGTAALIFMGLNVYRKWRDKSARDEKTAGSNDSGEHIELPSIESKEGDPLIPKKEPNRAKIIEEMQNSQKQCFTLPELRAASWWKTSLPLNEPFAELTLKIKTNEGEEINTISKREMFNDEIIKENKKSFETTIIKKPISRILIEGHPSYGKTTLVANMAFDWSKKENYIRDKFELIFLIRLRDFEGNLESYFNNLEGSDREKKDAIESIESIEHKILLLLDGLDECTNEVKEGLLPVLKGEKYQNMTVVVTCRTGLFNLETTADDVLNTNGRIELENFDRRIQIKGFSSEAIKNFLQSNFKIDNKQLEEKLTQFKVELSEFYECPLFLEILVNLIHEQSYDTFKDETVLYKKIFNCIVKRGLEREQIWKDNGGKEVDFFDMKQKDHSKYRQLLFKFAELCSEKVNNQSLVFEQNELLKCSGRDDIILRLGFLSKSNSFPNNEGGKYYELIPKFLLKLLANWYLSPLDEVERKSMDNK